MLYNLNPDPVSAVSVIATHVTRFAKMSAISLFTFHVCTVAQGFTSLYLLRLLSSACLTSTSVQVVFKWPCPCLDRPIAGREVPHN